MKSQRRRGILLAFAGMLIVSTDSPLTRMADTNGFNITFWMGVLTFVVLTTVVTAQGKNPIELIRLGGKPLIILAILQASSTTAFVHAVTKTAIANVVVIIAIAPMMAAALSWFMLRERTSLRVWAAIFASLVGIVIVVSGSFGGGSVTGDLLALFAVGLFSISLVILRGRPEVSRMMMVALAGVGMSLIAFIPATLWGHPAKTWLAIFLLGAILGPTARVMLASAPRYLPAAQVSLFTPVETIAATLWAYIFFDEQPPARTYVGGVIVIAAVVLGIWQQNNDHVPAAGPRL